MLTEFTLLERALIYLAGWFTVIAAIWIMALIAEGKKK